MDKTHRTPELEQLLLDGIASGTPLTQLCRDNGIVWRTVYKWLADPAFEAGMARARALGFDALVDEMLEIADNSRNDWIERDGKDPQRNPESVARSRLRIDTRMRILARWDPQRFNLAVRGLGPTGGVSGLIGGPVGAPNPDAPVMADPRLADTVALAARISAILASVSARDPADDWDDFSADEPGAELGDGVGEGMGEMGDAPGATVIDHEDIA